MLGSLFGFGILLWGWVGLYKEIIGHHIGLHDHLYSVFLPSVMFLVRRRGNKRFLVKECSFRFTKSCGRFWIPQTYNFPHRVLMTIKLSSRGILGHFGTYTWSSRHLVCNDDHSAETSLVPNWDKYPFGNYSPANHDSDKQSSRFGGPGSCSNMALFHCDEGFAGASILVDLLTFRRPWLVPSCRCSLLPYFSRL